jgi:hypothetical protein
MEWRHTSSTIKKNLNRPVQLARSCVQGFGTENTFCSWNGNENGLETIFFLNGSSELTLGITIIYYIAYYKGNQILNINTITFEIQNTQSTNIHPILTYLINSRSLVHKT